MANGAAKPLIFISYSHLDRDAKEFVQRHLGMLEQLGDIEVWEDSQIGLGDDWFQTIEGKLKECSVAVLLISTDFLRSDFCMKDEVPILLQRRHREGMMVAPILLRPCAWQIVPWLKALQMQSATPLLRLSTLDQEDQLAKVVIAIHGYLEDQAKLIASAIDQAKATGQRTEIRGDNNTIVQVDGDNVSINIVAGPKADTDYPALAEGAIDLTRLPTSGFDVVGRDKELQFLNEAFDGTELNVVSLRAWGGVGKSTLVNKWCEYLAADNFRGAHRVFAWSFYSQGTNERVTSADAFIDEALRFFEDADPTAGSPWAKGERLAELVGKEKALLLLDGMEPLQDEHQGIKDPALARLVECLAEENAGLCVITTREPVKEFTDFPDTTEEVDLEQLSKEAGRALLRIKGLRAADDLLEQTSEAFGNHALALKLLASYLKRFAGGDVSHALTIPDQPDISVEDGKHPRRVMAAFADKFGEGPELDLLHVIGLFDRPADTGCIAALRKEPVIPGLTNKLAVLNQNCWRDLLDKLRSPGLLAGANHHAPEELDAHPLVREHFGARLQRERPATWNAGHNRLYEFLQTVPEKVLPETLAEMAPLFQAVHHGCQAGRWQEALNEVYDKRIRRMKELYLTRKLGAFGAELGLMASFFDAPFELPAVNLTDFDRDWALIAAAFDLRSLGRIKEAMAPTRAALKMQLDQTRWREAAISADHLSELQLALGEVSGAITTGEEAVYYADRSGDLVRRITNRTALADARHMRGELDAAEALFRRAEDLRTEGNPDYPMHYSTRGYRYCDLLLTIGQHESALRQVHYTLEHIQQSSDLRRHVDLLSSALSQLSLGRIAMAAKRRDEADLQLSRAVEALREAGVMIHLLHGLLARAALFRETSAHQESRRDLAEVMRIAKRCGMRLHECDAHLEYARLALAEGRRDAALPHFRSADALVSECGYHRRDPEIAELKEKLGL